MPRHTTFDAHQRGITASGSGYCLPSNSRASVAAGVVSTRTHSRAMSSPFFLTTLVSISHRMRHDDDRQAHVPYALAHDLRKRRKRLADGRDGRDFQVSRAAASRAVQGLMTLSDPRR